MREITTTASTHKLAPSILREYDIRGVYGETLSATDFFYIGKSFATHVLHHSKENSIVVGRDSRLSSPELEAALIEGILSTGANVVRIGVGPTPMVYFSTWHLHIPNGIMVTGSHNPKHHNGCKFVFNKAPFFGDDIKMLAEMALSGSLAHGKGMVREEDVIDAYVEKLASGFTASSSNLNSSDLKIAWDAGNGAAGEVMARLVKRLPGTHIILNETLDGNFPNHHPDPTVPENLEQLIQTVAAEKCDFGVAFDGDADRIGAVDSSGTIIWGDQLLLLLGREVIRHHPGATIIADVKASQVLFDGIREAGGNPLMWKTGHSLIKAKMAETKALLAGEMSGHIFFADRYYGFDDGLYAAVRLIDFAAHSPESITALVAKMPKLYSTPEIRIDCEESRKFAIIDEAKARLDAKGISYSAIDGLRVSNSHGWWLLRASNTQSCLVARCEADSQEVLASFKTAVQQELAASGLTVTL